MENLWKKRKPPVPISWNNLPDGGENEFFIKLFIFYYFIQKININLSIFIKELFT